MSDFMAIAASIEKFDGTTWQIWSYAVHAALMFMDAWTIADGSEHRPLDYPATQTPAPTQAEFAARQAEQASWDKRERQGRSLLILVVKPSIYQSIDLVK